MNYIGRFAPTPSGPLHFGSICTALGSFIDARRHDGTWRLRIDDLDTPRVRPGATEHILSTLKRLGMQWDGEVIYQRQHHAAYVQGLDSLKHRKLAYPCNCTRAMTRTGPYPGTCRHRQFDRDCEDDAVRARIVDCQVLLQDRLRGPVIRDLCETMGDFIIRRADKIYAYHLASVVADAQLGVTDVVRGGDLLDASLCQVYLQDCLNLGHPVFCHLPLAVHPDGRKISKSTESEDRLAFTNPESVLRSALDFLGQIPEQARVGDSVDEIMTWAIDNWDLSRVPRPASIVIPASSRG